MELTIESAEFLLLVAALVAMVARRIRIPYTVILVVTGIALSFLPFTPEIELSKELIFMALLPPLIFEATLFIRWRELMRNLPVILAFATVGVLLSALLTSAGMVYLAGWTWQSAALFGILIAATDPVSVIATFKDAGVHGRLRLLVEAESLFNDATAAVGFGVVLAFVGGENISLQTTLLNGAWSIFGGLLIGALCAGLALYLTSTTDDHLAELALSTVAAYGSFLIAEDFHASGVLSTLTVGIVIGVREAYQDFLNAISVVIIAVIVVMVGRALAIYPLSMLFSRSKLKIERNHQHILFWGGLRGALALALALGLPDELQYREQIITAAFGVVAFSVFVQGLTMTPLLHWLKVLPSTPALPQEKPQETVELPPKVSKTGGK